MFTPFGRSKTYTWFIILMSGFLFLGQTATAQDEDPSESTAEQTNLFAGDIAIVGYNSGPASQIAFVLLENVAKGSEIRFTDNGWSNTLGLRQDEGVFTWTATQDMCAGTVVNLNRTTLNLSAGADQILSYQRDSNGRLSFLYALNSVTGQTGWQGDNDTTSRSALPTGLVDGVSAISVSGPPYAVYTGPTTGSKAEILDAIAVRSNWTTASDQPLNLSSPPFVVTDAAPCKICGISQERTYSFVGGFSAEVVSLGRFVSLRCIEVSYQPDIHPLGTQDLRYTLSPGHWRVSTEPPNALGFQAHITLEALRPINERDQVCHLVATTPVEWDCTAPTSFFETKMNLRNFSQFQDIAIGREADPQIEVPPLPIEENRQILIAFLGITGLLMVVLLGIFLWLIGQYRLANR